MLYAITDNGLLPGPRLPEAVAAALRGGCRWLQYRDKSGDADKRRREAAALLNLCRRQGARLIINDDVELAAAIGADGVHLGQEDGDPAAARTRLGADAIIGVTCHDSLALARQAAADGASYLAFGRFFPSSTKPQARPAPLSLLREAKSELGNLPLVAIGGITLDNAPQLIAAGADILAVCHDLFAAADIAARSRAFGELFNTTART